MEIRQKFVKAMGVLATAAAVTGYAGIIRPWHLRWGATDAEVAAHLPGDALVPHHDLSSTNAITIHAPVAGVWPWLVQIGQGRGGFYSYTWLENLLGCHMHNADRIVPELQALRPGDYLRLHPKGVPVRVAEVLPEEALVLAAPWSEHGGASGVWSFTLRPIDERTTRLIVRNRAVYQPNLGVMGNVLMWHVLFEPAHFIMQRKMMYEIKRLAEGACPP
jgi:hypothetical protein